MARKFKSATDQRSFTLIYNDFLESPLLNYYEKLIFIYLKKYADNDSQKGFPSFNTLHKATGISRSKIQECIDSMVEKGVLRKDHRFRNSEKQYQSNLYTLYDKKELWGAGSKEELTEVAKKLQYEEAKKIVEEYESKEKELKSKADQSKDLSPIKKSNSITYDTTTNTAISQAIVYSKELITKMFNREIFITDYPEYEKDFDSIINILFDVLNTSEGYKTIKKEKKSIEVVKSVLLMLTYEDIYSVIIKFHKVTEKIDHIENYIVTMLYQESLENHFKMSNTGHSNGDF